MNQQIKDWVTKFHGKDLPVCYGERRDSKPYTVGSGRVLFVGKDWLINQAEIDPELKKIFVMENL